MIADPVRRFLDNEPFPLEQGVFDRAVAGEKVQLTPEEIARVDVVSRALGLWDLDAPEDVGGHDLPVVAMIDVTRRSVWRARCRCSRWSRASACFASTTY